MLIKLTQHKKAIKVLFLTGCTGRGGAGHSLYYILKYLDRSRIEPLVIMPCEGVIGKRLKANGIRTIIAPRLRERFYEIRFKKRNPMTVALSILINLYDSLVFTSDLTKIIDKEGVELVYCNHMMVKVLGAVAGLLKGRPVIFHCRTIYSNLLERLFYVGFAALPNVKKIITVSRAAARNFDLLRHKVCVVPNGVDFDDHNPKMIKRQLRKQYQIPESAVIIGYVGRIVRWKGIDVFLKVAKKFAAIHKDTVFVVIGDYPAGSSKDGLVSNDSGRSKDGFANRVLFTGFKEDVRPYLKDLDIVVVPSISPDPCPRTVIEAMAFGIPIVGSALGGIQETIQHEHTGLLAEPGNVSDVTSKLLTIFENRALGRRLGVQARKTVFERYNAASVSARIQDIIFKEMGLDNHNSTQKSN